MRAQPQMHGHGEPMITSSQVQGLKEEYDELVNELQSKHDQLTGYASPFEYTRA
jgi:hypothetical protein